MLSNDRDDFTAISGCIERHIGDASCAPTAAAMLVPSLRILGRGEADPAWRDLQRHRNGDALTWPQIREECRRSVEAAGAWVGGKPDHVAAAIEDLAAMDLQHRQERRAALNAAWSDLLTA